MPSSYATIMLSGIFLDSSFFKSRHTGIRTFEASTILKEYGADNSLADDFLKDDLEEYKAVNDIIRNLEHPFYGVVVALANPNEIFDPVTIAKASNSCLQFKGIHASFVFGHTTSREIKMSCRSDGTVNVQLLAEKLGGGGHYSMSAVTFDHSSMDEVREMLINVLDAHLAEATNDDRNRKGEEEE